MQNMHTERDREQDLQFERDDDWLDEALSESFPASDPVPVHHKERDPSTENTTPANE